MTHNLIIIGSGPAGYTAAIYAARAELKPILFEGQVAGGQPGGQLMLTTDVENFPGFPTGIMGPDLMVEMKKQAERFGTEIVSKDVTFVDFSSRPFLVKSGDDEYRANSVIICTGAQAKWLGVPGEQQFQGHGVSACATCDGFFFKEKHVVVVGGGDAAMEEANFLTRFASKLTLLVRSDALRASKIMQERVKANPKITIMWNTEVVEVVGDSKMTGLKLKNNKTNEMIEIQADGLFVAIGHKPNTELFQGKLELDEVGYIVTKAHSTATSVDGVYAGGDVADHVYRQAISAAGTGCMAALDAERFLSKNH
ncbi:thioredoxin-disulfide reductase [Candidatus Uhrbacteria bacterium RIFCSPHIGHO2_02_FULL_47_44]|uniref:Thioredoxin reductase n=1 Tax=Candidatus Uhrbacteria bacterium RIFCSPLOWO2_02_FULL_48_18 TaxID=1802408 RepID=A0A1F7VCF8_9BACT|nr:MAG: thioredoxin-disulfide reductase [Candidatus Uhrbacteria bacterium RIFCSPHIGHO2_01_FULL_47_10]OGL70023.1 MAG: thioredoxin-disulfide reductase [Candidatus Uhrbacteria bacterium RIFCSPHIGHO2_02_FULL_47_44]OGL77315.1 MAG: thioredoxin-disulfide reductase [Candidatus Uhrbacteria bacterium RIFCSPHIGHO2_12_FULL_47_12]OGL80682.1 MAG: thioredoxin-disulfide reductase [Candidatus Uhrbacteria bacterium RIFCSPLOWO2_01_FULL_47_17]OGL88135.1 MAG: thioredoxin-disulfide reductase [Candidatus Uhrbacteria 